MIYVYYVLNAILLMLYGCVLSIFRDDDKIKMNFIVDYLISFIIFVVSLIRIICFGVSYTYLIISGIIILAWFIDGLSYMRRYIDNKKDL